MGSCLTVFFPFSDCFKQTQQYGVPVAVTTTYLASTMLHGLNFQLAAVLFSLGFYTYAEFKFREKLATIFNASIAARRPRDPQAAYRHKEGEFAVMTVNLVFGLITCFHLSYLGVMFNQDTGMVSERDKIFYHIKFVLQLQPLHPHS
jgi:porcupine-like protein